MFLCGVEVEVSFSALYSNVLVAFATVKNTGCRAQDCTVILSSLPTMEDIFSGPGRSDEMDTLLFRNSDEPDCTLRLCALQKLKESLVIKVDLHYTHTSSKLRKTESQHVDIGKPLMASCELSKRNFSVSAKMKDCHSAKSMEEISCNKPKKTLAGPCRPFTRKAVCDVQRSNEPEENDETEQLRHVFKR